ncbi:DUF3263 domain-containing protein [Marisediminicola senii]|uniref:DUF3263 domain-containing protein n=1 Tax=Marisediminicola senii TaxID=2711233 RepID=UPI0013EE2CB3|nr:DUF3263 domain-containing protein [Marisediminicola senii]
MTDLRRCDYVFPDERPCTHAADHRGRHGAKPTFQELVNLELAHPISSPAKQTAIDELGIGQARYYQLVNAMVNSPTAAERYPDTIERLRRSRTRALSSRSPVTPRTR